MPSETKYAEEFRKISFYFLAAYFCSTTFSHALSQIFFAGALLFFLLDWGMNKKFSWKPGNDLIAIFILLFVGWSVLSALVGPTPLKSLVTTREEWLFLMIPVAASALLDDKRRRTALRIFAVSAGLVSIYAVIQHFTGEHFYHGERLSPSPGGGWRAAGTFSHYLTFGNYYAMASAFFLSIAGGAAIRKDKILFNAAFALSAVATFLTFSYGPILALVFGVLVYLIFWGRKNMKWALSVFALVILLTAAMAPKIMARFLHTVEVESVGIYPGSRQAIWTTAIKMIPEHPLFGVGQGNFLKEYEKYRAPGSDRAFSHAHNDILNIAAYAGIPGALFYLGFWVTMLAMMSKMIRRAPPEEAELKGIGVGCLIFSLVFFVTSFYEASFTDEEVRLILMAVWGLFLAAKMGLKREWQTAEIEEKGA